MKFSVRVKWQRPEMIRIRLIVKKKLLVHFACLFFGFCYDVVRILNIAKKKMQVDQHFLPSLEVTNAI